MAFDSREPPHSKPLLEKALARVRYGFESDAIPGWRADLASDPEIKIHDDPDLRMTVQTLEIDLTAQRQ